MAFVSEAGQKPRQQTITARDLAALPKEITRAKARFGLAESARVVSCYEAGRDGFWLHRYLASIGVANRVVDSGEYRDEPASAPGQERRSGCGEAVIAAGAQRDWGSVCAGACCGCQVLSKRMVGSCRGSSRR